jgi:tetratricopeptide (TPR) repeat protein
MPAEPTAYSVEKAHRRERSIVPGDIARILVSKGQVDDALKLHNEMIEVFEALGDVDGIANTLWGMAMIELDKEQYQQAFENPAKSYQINLKLGRLDGICVLGLDLGRLLCQAGQTEQGLEILKSSHSGFLKLGQPAMAEQVGQMIAHWDTGVSE